MSRTIVPFALVFAASALWDGCAGQGAVGPSGGSSPANPSPLGSNPAQVANADDSGANNVIEQRLIPSEIDPAAKQFPAPQYAYTPAAEPRAEQLVVYLIGSRGVPTNGRSMGRYLAGLGFPVVIPGYPNDYDIRKLCERDGADPDCHEKLRLEAFEGRDHSPHITVAPADCTETRITTMLKALAQKLPAAGWGKFLNGDKPRWDQIIVSGHSHGASSAGLIAKHRKVFRAVMLSGPFDNRMSEPAGWTKRASLTPADRFYGFSHVQEEQHPGHLKDWTAIGVAGPVTNVDGATPPYGGSRQLITALPVADGANPHGSTAAGKSSPKVPTTSPTTSPTTAYVYDAAWRYLYGR
jgi:dienelactone hydrolase